MGFCARILRQALDEIRWGIYFGLGYNYALPDKTDQRIFVSVAFAIFFAEFVTLFVTIGKTEKALSNTFDIKGNRKSNFIFMYKLFAKYQ